MNAKWTAATSAVMGSLAALAVVGMYLSASASQTHDSMKLQMLLVQTKAGLPQAIKDLTSNECHTAKTWLLGLPPPSEGATIVYAECVQQ
jgi:hypothetical protein